MVKIIDMLDVAHLNGSVKKKIKKCEKARQRKLLADKRDAFYSELRAWADAKDVEIEKRRSMLGHDRCFSECKTARPMRSRFRNNASSEQAGRVGMTMRVARWDNSYITNVYKCRMY